MKHPITELYDIVFQAPHDIRIRLNIWIADYVEIFGCSDMIDKRYFEHNKFDHEEAMKNHVMHKLGTAVAEKCHTCVVTDLLEGASGTRRPAFKYRYEMYAILPKKKGWKVTPSLKKNEGVTSKSTIEF